MGYWRKVAKFPMPAIRNIQSIVQTNIGNESREVGVSKPPNIKPRHPIIRPIPESCVNMLPPHLSDNGPPPKRITEPMSGPMYAYLSGSGARAASIPGMFPYIVFIISGKAAANPANEPNVMMYVQVMKYPCLLSVISLSILPIEGFFIGTLLK